MRYSLIFIIQILSSCTQSECQSVDKKFASTFENHLNTIKRTQEDDEFVLVEPLTDAYLYMNAVTGIKARVSGFETPTYKNPSELHEDIERWENWFKKNKCSMTNQKADSLFRVYAYGKN
jgi:hypothetical protein